MKRVVRIKQYRKLTEKQMSRSSALLTILNIEQEKKMCSEDGFLSNSEYNELNDDNIRQAAHMLSMLWELDARKELLKMLESGKSETYIEAEYDWEVRLIKSENLI